MFDINYVEQNKKQTPGCFVMLSSSRDCRNRDSETEQEKELLSGQYRHTPYYTKVLP